MLNLCIAFPLSAIAYKAFLGLVQYWFALISRVLLGNIKTAPVLGASCLWYPGSIQLEHLDKGC